VELLELPEPSYYIDARLKKSLRDKVYPSLYQKDKDCFLVIDGREGSGKSTLAMQIGKYIDPTLDLSRIVFTPDAFREAIYKAKKGQCVIYDEAFTGFSSRSSLGQINRVLVSLSMQMRQKNLFVIIVLPTIFLLDKYIALFRAKALIHVYESKGVRGYFKLYNFKAKKLLILFGQKTFSYSSKFVRTNFRGRFYGKFALGSEEIEKKYRKKKEKALQEAEKSPMTTAQVRFREQRDILIYLLRKNTKLTFRELENLFADYEFEMNHSQISRICIKFGDSGDKEDEKAPKTSKKHSKAPINPLNEEKNVDNDEIVVENEEFDEKEPETEDFE